MHASWNQWGGAVPPQVPSYGTGYPQAAAPQASSFPQVNQFPVNAAPPVTAPPVPAPYQNPLYGQPQQPQPQPQQTQQQQWQQWEQWQQQYAQWHQQYGDKYQGPLPTGMLPPNMPSVPNTYSSIPPLPLGAPSAQPPPPDSVPPPSSDKNDTESGKRSAQDGGKEETKKQKTGKGKAETVEDLVEQEKTFDEQFKSWETSFIKWKEQNANHPDKAQYKEYEAKWENWREQLHQKREALRKKRENKEAEVAAAAAAAKEAALATSSNTAGYSTASVTQSNPYLTSNMMYPMAGMYPSQDIPQMTAQPPNYMANYPMYNMPPPTNMPPMSMMPPVAGHHDQQNKMDAAKSTQSLEFLSNSASNAKSIPGLDLVGSDKSISSAVSNIPPSSSLFSYNQDVTKPLHTSDDKPFNFPVPPQANNYNYNNQSQNQYSSFSLSRPPPSLPNQFQKNYNVDQRNDADYNDRNRYDDKFGNRGGMNSKFDYRQTDSRNDSMDRNSKFSSTYTPNFNSEKYAKYLEDEYDDSRFRDPEPPESPQHSKFNNYGRDERNNYSNFRSNQGGGRGGFNNKYDDFKRDFNDLSNNRKEMGRGFRGRPDIRPQFGDRNKPENSFNSRFSNRGPFGRGGPGGDNGPRPSFNSWQSNEPKGPAQDRFDNVESEKTDSGKPISLLDLPMMKPPDLFEKKPFTDGSFGSDIGPEGVANKNDVDNSRLGPNDPGSFKGPSMFGDANNSRSGPKDGSPFEIGVGSRTDMNKFHPPMGFPPKNSQPSTASRNKDGSSGDNSATAEESTEELVLSMTFDYEHVKKTSAESVPDSFDAVYVFDYGHGKKKVVDNKDFIDSLASEVENNGDTALEGDSWSAEKKNDAGKPLPQRIRQSNDLTKELAAILNKSDHSSETKTNENGNDTIEKKIETAPWQRESIDKAEEASKVVAENALVLPNSKLVDDLLLPPGRHSRPIKLVVIMRGLPGSGKTYTAKLMKDKEVELGGSAPRILSLDDYFTVENDTEETDPTSGKKITKKEMVYEYDADLEPSYHESLVKSFKKTVADGFFPFIIVDCINDKIKKYEEMYSYAMSQGFQVFVCEMDTDASTCVKRNIHSRTEDEINKILEGWEKTPASQTLLDIRSLLQSAAITEVDMADAEEEIEEKKETEESKEETNDDDKIDEETEAKPDQDEGDAQEEDLVDEEAGDEENTEKEGFSSYMESLCTSKWENMENTEDKLDRLDGVSKKRSSTSFKEWLQLPEDQTDLSWYAANDKASESNVSRKKRVRWADLEERVAQEKMRAIGFVVGQTDWNRMMDPSFGGSKLTQTKYIYK